MAHESRTQLSEESSLSNQPEVSFDCQTNQGDNAQCTSNSINDLLHNISLNRTVTGTKCWKDILTHTNAVDIKEADIYQCLITYLKSIFHNRQKFMNLLSDIFGIDRITDSAFVYFLASQLKVDYQNLKGCVTRWVNAGMEDERGKWSLSLDVRQQIYDIWIENSQPSTDNRNDRCRVKIPKMDYLKKYYGIEREWSCTSRTWKKCKGSMPATLKCQSSNEIEVLISVKWLKGNTFNSIKRSMKLKRKPLNSRIVFQPR